ncbi:hypothetical protein [Candidatus Berkiella aquae]|uniref:Uncharacterized protein n=1 Tax=Candidatus Berkiella aquae TaxID=295108 RepID=A0A0Q9YWD9_9GAMM|nr:hypothetical protein [Candidatus Berkiella aquae]MCS5711103.1 hypothetical protein [Candidatus Berkiella aquae]
MSMDGVSSSDEKEVESTRVSDPLTTPEKFTKQRVRLTEELLDYHPVDNRLYHLEALAERLKNGNEALEEGEQAELYEAAEQLARNISSFELKDIEFKEKQAIIQGFLKTIRSHISEPILTPGLVIQTMLKLQAQFAEKAEARKQAVELAGTVELAKHDIARLEKLSQPSTSNASEASTSNASEPSTSPLAIAKESLAALERTAQEAKELAEKPTAIPLRYQGLYNGFVKEMLNPRHSKRLEAITYQLQFANIQEAETLKETDMLAASASWDATMKGRKARLADVASRGKAFTGIVERVEEWNAKMPKALSSEEMLRRDAILPYEEGELKERREERLRHVSGFEPRRAQLEKMAVAKDKATRRRTHPIAKDLHELDDHLRQEFEDLGIKRIPNNKQHMVGVLLRGGADVWNVDFEYPQYLEHLDPKPHRAMLDDQAPVAFPERKAHYKKALVPGLERHLQLGAKEGYFVGQKGQYWKPSEEDHSLDALTEKLGHLKLR